MEKTIVWTPNNKLCDFRACLSWYKNVIISGKPFYNLPKPKHL